MVFSIPIWATIALVVLIVYLVIYIPFAWLREKYRPGRDRRKAKRKAARLEWEAEQKKKPKKGPGLIESYVKARKEKVCPLIEVVDERPWDE